VRIRVRVRMILREKIMIYGLKNYLLQKKKRKNNKR